MKLPVLALATGLAFGGPAAAQNTPGKIRIGVLTEVTGPVAQAGLAMMTGARIATKEINASGGILGRQVELVIADYRTDPTIAVTEAKRLASQEKVDFIIGPSTSPATLAAMPVFVDAKLFQISMAGTMQLTPQVGPYWFGVLANAKTQGEAMVDYVANVRKAKSAAIITDDTAQSKDGVEVIKAALAARNIKFTGAQEFRLGSKDMTAQLLSLRRGRPDALLLWTSTAPDTGAVVKSLREIGWDVHVTGSPTVALLASGVVEVAGPDAFKNMVGGTYAAYTYCPKDPPGSSPFAKLLPKIREAAPDTHQRISTALVAYFYDAVYIAKQAAEGVGRTDGPAMAAWLEKNATKVKVVSGPLSASPQTHFLWGSDALTMVENPDKRREDGLQKRAGC
jgi:ABC-type branched-subunit amino acid transport system substrate-binding protein